MKKRIALVLVCALMTVGLSGCSVFYSAEIHDDEQGFEYRECGLLGFAKTKKEPTFGFLPLYRETIMYEED